MVTREPVRITCAVSNNIVCDQLPSEQRVIAEQGDDRDDLRILPVLSPSVI
jgi:hypothetical protein